MPKQPADFPELPTVIDEWGVICERCPLADCVRLEGEYRWYVHSPKGRRAQCLIEQAQRRGWQAAEALARAEELKLLPAVEWVEM